MMYNTSYGKRAHPFGRGFGPGFRRPKYNVPVNIDERPDHYLVSVYATGFNKENIKLSVNDDILLITGTREVDENEKFNFIKQEFPVRNFEKMISLENQVDVSAITARSENGVLLIHLPKTEDAKQPSREIRVD